MTTTESLEQRLAGALGGPVDPRRWAVVDVRIAAALAAGRPRRKRLPMRRSLLLVAALLVILPTVYGVTAGIYHSEDPYGLEDSAAYQAELQAAMAAVPLPDGRGWPAYLGKVNTSAYYSRGGGRSEVELNAACIWLDDWYQARKAGAADEQAVAARTIAGIRDWPSWRSPFWTKSVTDHFEVILAAVAADDPAPVEHDLSTNCAGAIGD